MTAVFVFRHPQTTWNAESRYQGRLEAPLSREGHTQARTVCRALEGHELDAVVSSPLVRALGLARPLASATDARLVVDQRLTELGQTPWEGMHVDQIPVRFPELWREWHERPDQVHFRGGERLADVAARVHGVLGDIAERYPGGLVAVVTHSVVIQVMVALAIGLDLRYLHRLGVSNASLTTLCVETPPGSLLTFNSTDLLYRSPIAAAAARNCPPRKRSAP